MAEQELDYYALRHKRLDELREMAHEHTQEGVSLMKREQLIDLLCDRLGISKRMHAEGIDVAAVKQQIKALKIERGAALEAKDSKVLKAKRRKIRALKRRIRKAAVETARRARHAHH